MTIPEILVELEQAKTDLRKAKRVSWGYGMVSFNNQLTKVTRLTAELNKALKAEEAI